MVTLPTSTYLCRKFTHLEHFGGKFTDLAYLCSEFTHLEHFCSTFTHLDHPPRLLEGTLRLDAPATLLVRQVTIPPPVLLPREAPRSTKNFRVKWLVDRGGSLLLQVVRQPRAVSRGLPREIAGGWSFRDEALRGGISARVQPSQSVQGSGSNRDYSLSCCVTPIPGWRG